MNKINDCYSINGSEADFIKETIIESLNQKEKSKLKNMADYLSKSMEKILIENHKEEINFDYVFDKVYSFFNDPLLCEMIFDKLQTDLQEKYDIDMRQKDI